MIQDENEKNVLCEVNIENHEKYLVDILDFFRDTEKYYVFVMVARQK